MAFFQNSKEENKFDDVTLRGMRDQQWSDKKDEMKDMRRNARGFFQLRCEKGSDLLKQLKS